PKDQEPRAFGSIEEICNYLLGHKEVVDWVRGRRRDGATGKVAFLMFDEETEQLAGELGLDVAFPSAALRHRLDSKIVTTRLAEEAGVPSVPNALGRADSYSGLLALAGGGGLGTDLVGQTPYGGGWCGNDIYPDALSPEHRARARAYTVAMGERLAKEGYRGYFELDFLADVDSGQIYLGELNPRVTGASSMTNVTSVAYGDMPLFLFHLLEYMDVEYRIDVDKLNARWAEPKNLDAWSQFILKETEDRTELITGAPATGVWRMASDGSIAY